VGVRRGVGARRGGLPGAAVWSAGLRWGRRGYRLSRRGDTVSPQAQEAGKVPLAACGEVQSWGAGLAVGRVGSAGQPGKRRSSGLRLPGSRSVLARAERECVAFTDPAAGQPHCSRSHAARRCTSCRHGPHGAERGVVLLPVSGVFLRAVLMPRKVVQERTPSGSLLPSAGQKAVLHRSCRASALAPMGSVLPPAGRKAVPRRRACAVAPRRPGMRGGAPAAGHARWRGCS